MRCGSPMARVLPFMVAWLGAFLEVVESGTHLRTSKLSSGIAREEQPSDNKKVIYPVIFMGDYKYVDKKKFKNMVFSISQPVLGETGLVTGKDFGSMVAYDRTVLKHSRVVVVPSQDYDNILNMAPEVKVDLRQYVESGKVLVVTLSDPGGMDNPLNMINDIFNMSMDGQAVPAGNAVKKDETLGFAWAFDKAAPELPFQDNVWGVTRASLRNNTYKLYSDGDVVAVFMFTYGSGLVIGIGHDYQDPDTSLEWRTVLRLAVDTGLFLDKIRLGNSVVHHQGSTFAKIQPYGNWSADGREVLPDKGLGCMAWRKTLNCDPSGPRDFHGDKNCSDIVPADESGYCECEGYVQTAVATCKHRLISCKTECAKVSKRYRDLYGDKYKEPGLKEMQDLIEGAYKKHHQEMMHKADVATANVNRMVKAMKHAHEDLQARLKGFKDPPMWKQIAKAGRDAVEAGKQVQGMASLANPYLEDSVYTFPKIAPNPPPPAWGGYQPANPIFQKYVADNAYKIANTPAP